MIDCFMVASDEPNADANWQRLLEVMPHAKRVGDAGSIFSSYRECARQCKTNRFFVVDADNWIVENFDFEWGDVARPGHVFVWRAHNPVNNLVYGHGAIKLFCVDDWRGFDSCQSRIDVTMSIGDTYRIVDRLASEHRFNTSPFHAWRTAFRECVKLSAYPRSKPGADVAADRLKVWVSEGENQPYGKWCVLGAQQGAAFGRQHFGNPVELLKVNDYQWLKDLFALAG